MKQATQTAATEKNVGQSSKLGVGGTYANFEALKSASRTPQKDKTIVSDNKSAPERVNPPNVPRIRIRPAPTTKAHAKPLDEPKGRDHRGIQFVKWNKKNPNTRDWQPSMQEIAKNAVQLSQVKVRLNDTEVIGTRRTKLNYSALYIDAPKSSMESHLPLPWAVRASDVSKLQSIELLDQEIDKFAKFVDCSPAEKAAREAVISEARSMIATTLPGVESEVFGSQATGLATATSDIDIRVSVEGVTSPRHLIETMKRLLNALVESKEFMCTVIRYAKYPVISTQHTRTGIDIQIVSAPDTKEQREITAHYLEKLPHLRSIYMVLKTTFGIRGLIDVFSGGTGSYGLLMMLVASLERQSSKPPTTAGEQLLRFLDFYSDLNITRFGVSISPPKLFKKHDAWELPIKEQIDAARRRGDTTRAAQWAIGQKRLYQPYLFCLQDPANTLNDLGRKTNAIKHIQRTIFILRNHLKKDLAGPSSDITARARWTDDSILLPFVGRCHEIYHERRKKTEEYGVELIKKQQHGSASV